MSQNSGHDQKARLRIMLMWPSSVYQSSVAALPAQAFHHLARRLQIAISSPTTTDSVHIHVICSEVTKQRPLSSALCPFPWQGRRDRVPARSIVTTSTVPIFIRFSQLSTASYTPGTRSSFTTTTSVLWPLDPSAAFDQSENSDFSIVDFALLASPTNQSNTSQFRLVSPLSLANSTNLVLAPSATSTTPFSPSTIRPIMSNYVDQVDWAMILQQETDQVDWAAVHEDLLHGPFFGVVRGPGGRGWGVAAW